MSSDATGRPDDPSADPGAYLADGRATDEWAADEWGADGWRHDLAEPDADPSANLFADEIENVDASDWDVDTALIWGDGGDSAGGGDLGIPL